VLPFFAISFERIVTDGVQKEEKKKSGVTFPWMNYLPESQIFSRLERLLKGR
jgi:hypothetical protein